MSEVMTLVVGSTRSPEVELVNENGAPESLAGADRASLTVRQWAADDADVVVEWDTVTGNLSIDVSGGKLVATLTALIADALVIGEYVGQAAVRYGNDNSWIFTDYFRVTIVPMVAKKV